MLTLSFIRNDDNHTKYFHQRKTSADKSRNIVKGRKISQAEHDGKKINFFFFFCIININLF